MADKESTQKMWERKIRKAEHEKEEWEKKFRVELARAYYEGDQNPGFNNNEWITVNKIYSNLQSQLPSLYSVDPYFYVKVARSYKPDPSSIALFEQRGAVRQSFLNYLKKELNLKAKVRLSIQDAHFSFGVIKTRYRSDMQDNPEYGREIMDDDGTPMLGDDGQALMEPEKIPVNDRYEICRVDPDDFFWLEDSGPLEDKWPGVAERIKMPIDEALNDPRFNRAALREATKHSADSDEEPLMIHGKSIGDSKDEIVILWEIYNLRSKKWIIIAEGANRPVMEERDLPPGVEDHPYSILRFTVRGDSAYPIPPVSQALDLQREYNTARSKVMTHRKRFNRKYEVFESGLVDPDVELAKLESGDDGTIIRKQHAGPVVTTIQDAPLDPQMYSEINILNFDIVEVLGSSDNARGIAKADTATEASLIDKHLEVREGDKLSQVVDFVTSIAKKLDQLVQANITQDEAVLVTGLSGDYWSLVRATDYEEIAGEFEYSVNIGATQPRLPNIERSQWLAFLQIIAGFPQFLLARRLLKKMAEMHHIEDDAMLDELFQLGQQMMSGQGQGQSAGGDQGEITKVLGQALGSLGGTTNGGGAPTVQ